MNTTHTILTKKEFFRRFAALGIVPDEDLYVADRRSGVKRLAANLKTTGRSVFHYMNDFTTPEHVAFNKLREHGEESIAYKAGFWLVVVQ
jgi:hypothetical protein